MIIFVQLNTIVMNYVKIHTLEVKIYMLSHSFFCICHSYICIGQEHKHIKHKQYSVNIFRFIIYYLICTVNKSKMFLNIL